MSKPVVQGKFYEAGSAAKIDGTFSSLIIDTPEDGYVFEDPKNKNLRIFMAKAEFEAQYQLAPPKPAPEPESAEKQAVKAKFYKEGSVAKIDGTFTPLLIDVPSDGYVFEDPKNNNARTYLPKAEFDAKYTVAAPKAVPQARPPGQSR